MKTQNASCDKGCPSDILHAMGRCKPEHTPPPWKVAQNNDDVIVDSHGIGIAEIQRKANPLISKANIHFIVRAVNSHEKLLEAAKIFERHLANEENHSCSKTCEIVRQAISQAEGK